MLRTFPHKLYCNFAQPPFTFKKHRIEIPKTPVGYRPTPFGRCLFTILVGRVVAFAPTPALSKDQPLCGCVLQTYFSFHLCACQSSILLGLCAQMSHRFFTTCGFMIDQHPLGVVCSYPFWQRCVPLAPTPALSKDQPLCGCFLQTRFSFHLCAC